MANNSIKFLKLCIPICIFVLSITIKSGSAIKLFNVSDNANEVKFYYHPVFGVRREVKYNDVSALAESGLKDGASTVIIIDGFTAVSSTPLYQRTTEEYLGQNKRQNVFTVDYSRLSGSGVLKYNRISAPFNAALLYQQVLKNVGPVGMRVADFMKFLKDQGFLSYSSVQIIGMSLGAHIAGAAGGFLQEKENAKVGRITGLDPAFSFFPFRLIQRVRKNSANFVDIYHTNRGTLGETEEQTGHLNVYINDGANQPGCHWKDITGFPGFCSHIYASKLFIASFTKDLKACPCDGYDCLCKSKCKVDNCTNPVSVMSRLSDTTVRGTYHVSINDPLLSTEAFFGLQNT